MYFCEKLNIMSDLMGCEIFTRRSIDEKLNGSDSVLFNHASRSRNFRVLRAIFGYWV